MPSISSINQQLLKVENIIQDLLSTNLNDDFDLLEKFCRIQKILIETQITIFIEATESDLDMPELPLFCEGREEEEDA